MTSDRVPKREIFVTKCEVESMVRLFRDPQIRERIGQIYGKADTSLTTTGLMRAINKIEAAQQAIVCEEARARAEAEIRAMARRGGGQKVAQGQAGV